MRKGKFRPWWVLAVAALVFLTAGLGAAAAQDPEVPLITKEDLKPGLCSPNLTVVDVRAPEDWAESDRKIKCAAREDPGDADSWAKKYPHYWDIVLYCS